MHQIEWKDEYSVGIKELDEQHKELFRLINRLYQESESAGMITYAFDSLERYVNIHFRTEEKLLEKAAYADLKAHKIEHKQFEDWLKSVKITFAAGASPQRMAGVINEYLQDWWTHHILESDMNYSEKLVNNSLNDNKN